MMHSVHHIYGAGREEARRASSSNPLRIPHPKIDKLACQAKGEGIFAVGEITRRMHTVNIFDCRWRFLGDRLTSFGAWFIGKADITLVAYPPYSIIQPLECQYLYGKFLKSYFCPLV